MEVFIYNVPYNTPSAELRERVAHALHTSPVSARNDRGRLLNFQLWTSQHDGRPGFKGRRYNSNNNANQAQYSSSARGLFARVIIPNYHSAIALIEETRKRPIKLNNRTLKFVAANGRNRRPPYEVIARLLAQPYGGAAAVQQSITSANLWRGFPLTSIQLGTVNRNADFGPEHTLYDISKAKDGATKRSFTPPDLSAASQATASTATATAVTANTSITTTAAETIEEFPHTAILCFDNRRKGICLKIKKKGRTTTVRMHLRTIENIYWSNSTTILPNPSSPTSTKGKNGGKNAEGRGSTASNINPLAFRKRDAAPAMIPPLIEGLNDDDDEDNNNNGNKTEDDLPAPSGTDADIDDDDDESFVPEHDVLIRLSQPFVLEELDPGRNCGGLTRLVELQSKPHITPYCFTDVWISGPNLLEPLKAMAKLYNTPVPWEQHIHRSSARRYRQAALEDVEDRLMEMPIPLAFQYQKLLSNRVLDPKELLQAIDIIDELFSEDGDAIRTRTARRLAEDDRLQRVRIEDKMHETFKAVDLRERVHVAAAHSMIPLSEAEDESTYDVLSVNLTPTGMQLIGPTHERSNRIIRRYRDKKEHFLRVSFLEEDFANSSFISRQEYNVEQFCKARFGVAMKEGIFVAGRLYEFLAYSQSSLREGTVWFMNSFEHEGRKVTAQSIRDGLGDFDHLKYCPARYAARMSQAFTATYKGLIVDQKQVFKVKEIERNGKTFSDGIGRISPDLADQLQTFIEANSGSNTNSNRHKRPKNKASAFQIRISGSKGMVMTDPRIAGSKLYLRNSMIKYIGRTCEIEVADIFTSPKAFRLNRPLIKILEDLGVPFEEILRLQRDDVASVYEGIRNIGNAQNFLDRTGFGTAFHASGIMGLLHKHKITYDDLPKGLANFCKTFLTFAAIRVLRGIKTKARINVPGCWTVVGGLDESRTLAEGEVFVCIKPEKGERETQWIEGTVAVTRSPMIHPGDIRVLKAVGRPKNAYMLAQTNAILFSVRGDRPEQDKMSGGDLDGGTHGKVLQSYKALTTAKATRSRSSRKQYNVITQKQPLLIPQKMVEAAEYPAAVQHTLDRPCDIGDVADFVCLYMCNDFMGIIANKWLITSDTAENGSLDTQCQLLTQEYTKAVDFPKSGTPVEITKLPRSESKKKPDFMATSMDDPKLIYESKRALGRLFRDIEIPEFKFDEQNRPYFTGICFDTSASHASDPERYQNVILHRIQALLHTAEHLQHLKAKAERLAEDYYRNMEFCSHAFRIDDEENLTEEECFLSMVGTPVRSAQRHDQSVRLTLFVSHFLGELREELSDDGDSIEEVAMTLGLATQIWLVSRDDFEDARFGCYSLNLIAFEAMMAIADRLEDLIDLTFGSRKQ